MNHPKKCKHCDGAGEVVNPYNSLSTEKYHKCYHCHGTGTNPERWTSDYENARYLSNNDTDSQPVCISNIRVWREEAKESEDKLWRHCTGAYGSSWIEIDKRLDVPDTHLKAIARKAWNLGFDSVARVADMLVKLSNYPTLDEEDEGEAEREEQQEHWENYGRGDLRSIVDDMLDQAIEECPINDGQLDGHKHFGWSDLRRMDELYYELCEAAEFYPERIDSSAWNFGLERPRPERTYNYRSHIWQLLQERPWLIYREQKPQTLQDFIIEHQGETLPDDVLVSIDRLLERGEVDQHIAEQALSKPNSPAKESSP